MEFTAGARVRNTVTGETGTVMHGNVADGYAPAGQIVNVRYDRPLRGCSPQRDEFAGVHVPASE